MREFFIQITDVIENGELTAHTTPSIINKAGIAGEHNASRLIFSLPESWDAEWEYQVECVNSTNEGTVSEPLTVSEERTVVFDIPQGMTQAGQGNYTLQGIKREGDKVVSIYRSATVYVYFAKSPKLGTRIVNAIESVLSGLFAKINNLVDRFNAGEFNGKDGEKGEKGDKGDKGDKGEDGKNASIPVVSTLPEIAEENDICILAPFNTLTTEDSGKKIYFKWEEFAEPRDEFTDVLIALLNKGEYVFELQMIKGNGASSAYFYKFVGDISYRTYIEFTDGYFGESYVETEEGTKTYFNSIAELPSYIQLPAFDSVEVLYTSNVPMFYTSLTPMIYIGGWTKLDEESHSHANKALLDTLTQEWLDSIVSGGGLTPEQAADLEANTAARHTHRDKDILDKIYATNWYGTTLPMYDDGSTNGKDVWTAYHGSLIKSIEQDEETGDVTITTIRRHVPLPLTDTYQIKGGNRTKLSQFVNDVPYVEEETFSAECDAIYVAINSIVDEYIANIEARIDGIEGGIDEIELTEETATLQPNVYYSFDEMATLTLEFAEGNESKVNEYMFGFVSGATPTVLTLPDTVKWVNELTIEANKRYEISIVDNIGLWCAVEVDK